MENTLDRTFETRYVKVPTGFAGSPEIVYNDHISYMDIRRYERPGKRQRPEVLSVSVNTPSVYSIRRHILLQMGKTGPSEPWEPYGSYDFRWDSPLGLEPWDVVESRAYLTSMDELRPVIQNKILSDVVSGKAQLAVDLVELQKTKSMFANAGLTLLKAFRDLRAGRPFRQLAIAMREEGFSGLAGRKWLEFIYGWAPTVSGAFDTAEVLSQKLQAGLVVRGRVKAQLKRTQAGIPYGFSGASFEAYCDTTARGYYEYTVRDPKLLRLSQLGFTNPLAIAWELTPWSFVLDWFVDVGGYISRMDFALGISNFTWQYACFQKCRVVTTYYRHPSAIVNYTYQPGKSLVDIRRHIRDNPSSEIVNTFRGFKRFTNETVRLTSAVALLNQQRLRLKELRL